VVVVVVVVVAVAIAVVVIVVYSWLVSQSKIVMAEALGQFGNLEEW
jgi:hypothetical protein